MSDESDLSSIEDYHTYDESSIANSNVASEDENEDHMLDDDDEEEEEEEDYEDPLSADEEDDYNDEEPDYEGYDNKSKKSKDKSPVKLKIRTPKKPSPAPSKVTKPTPKKGVAIKKAASRPARPSKLSQEITEAPSRPKRGNTKVNYNVDVNEADDDLLEEDDEDLEPTPQPQLHQEEIEDEDDLIDEDEDVIPTPALEDLSDDDLESYSDYQTKPDLMKMTERQRAMLEDNDDNESDSSVVSSSNSQFSVLKSKNSQFLSLSNDIRKRHVLTEEENQIRKAEIARKRKNLSEKKLEEEKQDTINKLLKRRAKTTRSKKAMDDEDEDNENSEREKPRKPQLQHKALFRWTSNKDGLRLGVPQAFVRET